MKKIAAIFAVIALLAMMAVGCGATKQPAVQYEEEYKLTDGTKAIVILPGLLAGGLYDEETGKALWDPVKSDNVDLLEFMGVYDETHVNITIDSLTEELFDLLDYAADVIGDTENSIMRHIMCDENGDPANPHVKAVPVGYEGHIAYGALNSYKWWVEGLQEAYGDEYEVVVYNYNWLTDTRYAARDFAAFMNQKNYTETILIGHSMGGIVASEYLAMDAKSRARVDKFIAVAVPFYGSYMATSTFEDPYVFMDYIDDALNSPMFKEGILSKMDLSVLRDQIAVLYDNMIIPFLFNMKSVYQLLPSPELMALQSDIEGEGAYNNGQKIASDDLFSWYSSRPFVTDTPLATREEVAGKPVRKIFADWQEYRDGFYVDKPDGKVFSCDLVDTYYVVGVGSPTEVGVHISGETLKMSTSTAGDGTVPMLSATRGLPLDSDHVFAVEGEQHIPMGTHWDGGQKEAVYTIIGTPKTAE